MDLLQTFDILVSSLAKWESGVLILMVLLMVYQLYYYLRYINFSNRKYIESNQSTLPKVSVVVCAHNERENLENYLHTLLSQDYPEYEVIVVDDESEDNSLIVLEQYARQYPNFYHTFVPDRKSVV